MLKRGFGSLAVWVIMLLLLWGTGVSRAESSENQEKNDAPEKQDDSASQEVAVEDDGSFKWSCLWMWPFNNVIQPALNGLIYPIAKPVDYAFENDIIQKSVDLITFGEKRNILIYPGFNLKPGSQTMLGLTYRHRGILLNRDYLVLQGGYFANGDVEFSARYTKQALFGSNFFGGFRYNMEYNRDHVFRIPETQKAYLEPDSTYSFTWRLGTPLPRLTNWNTEAWVTLKCYRYSHPDVEDSLLISDDFPIDDRGIYQNRNQLPIGFSIVYDNIDNAYAPSRGTRAMFRTSYYFVGDYSGVNVRDLGLDPEEFGKERIESSDMNHDYISTEFVFQHYFYLGKSKEYMLSVKEARVNRRFYTDFSWDEALRIWRPEQVRETLFERRVIALQYRLMDLWEMEKGGAPHDVFVRLNANTPLRGYSDSWTTHHMMSLSAEYRWPVDRFVDGVLFDEYAMIAPEVDEWSFSHFYNSWGFGIRVRMPNMYLFRVQFGFHGLHGVNLIMTIAPEFK